VVLYCHTSKYRLILEMAYVKPIKLIKNRKLCKESYPSVRRYKDTLTHVDQSDVKSRFDGEILNSHLRSVPGSE
jgi:hypothetical protein